MILLRQAIGNFGIFRAIGLTNEQELEKTI